MHRRLTWEQVADIQSLYRTEGDKTRVAALTGHARNTIIRHTKDMDRKSTTGTDRPEPAVEPTRSFQASAEQYAPKTAVRKGHRRIACLYDMHHPFHDIKGLDAVFDFLRYWEPDLLVFGGDALDFHGISRWPKNPNRRFSIQDELDSLEPTLARADRLGCEVDWIDGNHEHRLERHIIEHPTLYRLRSLELPSLLRFPTRWQYHRNQGRVQVGRLLIHHGDLVGRKVSGLYPARNMLSKLRTTNMFGHLHHEDVAHMTEFDGSVTSSYACGHLCDPKQVDYVANPDWQSGFPIIEIDRHGIEHVTMKRIIHGSIYHEGDVYGGR